MRTYKTQMEAAKRGIVTPEMELVAKKEYMEPETLRQLVAKGEVAIPCNIHHTSISPEGIGGGLRTKINVNLGISGDCNRYDMEMQKVDLALQFGAEAIMDLSNYGKTNTFRRELIAKSPAMIGTVPMYDAIGYLEKETQQRNDHPEYLAVVYFLSSFFLFHLCSPYAYQKNEKKLQLRYSSLFLQQRVLYAGSVRAWQRRGCA